MKANRAVRRAPVPRRGHGQHRPGAPRRFLDDDAGVSEAVGYIITFGISTVILVTSLQAMTSIQHYTEDISRDRAADEVSAQVAFQVQQALKAGAKFPESQADFTIPVPREVAGSPFRIVLTNHTVYTNATVLQSARSVGALGTAETPLLNKSATKVLCNGPSTEITGGTCAILSSIGEITISYGKVEVNGVADRWGVYIRNPVV